MAIHRYVRKINIERHFATIPVRNIGHIQSEYDSSGLDNASLFNPQAFLPHP